MQSIMQIIHESRIELLGNQVHTDHVVFVSAGEYDGVGSFILASVDPRHVRPVTANLTHLITSIKTGVY